MTSPAPSPATLAPTPAKAKNRPRSMVGMALPTTSIQAGMSTPPVPAITSNMARSRTSVRPGAGSARVKAAAARTR